MEGLSAEDRSLLEEKCGKEIDKVNEAMLRLSLPKMQKLVQMSIPFFSVHGLELKKKIEAIEKDEKSGVSD